MRTRRRRQGEVLAQGLRHDRRRLSPAPQTSEESDSFPSLQVPFMGWPGTQLQVTWGHPALDSWPCLSKVQRAAKSSHGPAVRAKLPLLTLSVLQVAEWNREHGQLFPLAVWPWASPAPS